MIIKIDQELTRRTNFKDTVEVEGRTVSEALLNLFEEFPQLYIFLVCKGKAEANKTTLKLNGEYLIESSSLYTKVGPTDVLEVGRDVPEGAGTIGKIILGVGLLALSIWNPAIGVEGAVLLSDSMAMGMGMMGASLVLGGVGDLLVGTPNLPSDGNSTSNTYTFSGIKNSTVSGTAIPIIYGRHRVGGHVLSAYVDVPQTNGNSFLYAQLGVSEGEIDGIDYNSIEINQRNVRDFDDVSAYWRKGETDPVIGVDGTLFSPTSSYNEVIVGLDVPWQDNTTWHTGPDPRYTTRTTGGKVEH